MWVIPGFYSLEGYGWVTPELVFARVLKHETDGVVLVFLTCVWMWFGVQAWRITESFTVKYVKVVKDYVVF